jgi:hypothetical protein
MLTDEKKMNKGKLLNRVIRNVSSMCYKHDLGTVFFLFCYCSLSLMDLGKIMIMSHIGDPLILNVNFNMEIGNKKYVENMHKIYILYRKI